MPARKKRVLLEKRGVTIAIVKSIFGGASAALTPGQLVHGNHTSPGSNDWEEFDPKRFHRMYTINKLAPT